MAWPATPIQTFVDGSPPPYNAAFGNALQSGVNNLVQGTQTFSTVYVDGLGGTSRTLPATDIPLALFTDKSGNVRSVYDHNGFRMGRTVEWAEEWVATLAAFSAAASPASSSLVRWSAQTSNATPIPAVSIQDPTTSIPYRSLQLSVSGDAPGTGVQKSLSTIQKFLNFGSTFLSFVAEWEMSLDAASSTTRSTGLFIGFSDTQNPATINTGATQLGFWRPSGTQHWQGLAAISGGASSGPVDLNYAFAANEFIRCRLEVHGSTSPYGAIKIRLFINETLQATLTQLDVANSLYFIVQMSETASVANTTTWAISPIRTVWNRMLSLPTL